MNHIIENCGNFAHEILEGLIGYGRETEKGRGKKSAQKTLPGGDGYATAEADILVGGFLRRYAAQEAARMGRSYLSLSVQEKERLTLKLSVEHIARHGEAAMEHYRHWLIRVQNFARHQKIKLPAQNAKEHDYPYSLRLRRWIKDRDGKWPALRPAVGTHLVFSPDPKIWKPLRAIGSDERLFLKAVVIQTMKEFSDWRRKALGTGHSLGWAAGTHVKANGADRHPHLHLVVLKRDENGRQTDWSVTRLKGHRGKTGPDPLQELKRLFEKNVEQEVERLLGKETVARLQRPTMTEQVRRLARKIPTPSFPTRRKLRRLARGLRAVFSAMSPYRKPAFTDSPHHTSQIGAALRFMGRLQSALQGRSGGKFTDPAATLAAIVANVRKIQRDTTLER